MIVLAGFSVLFLAIGMLAILGIVLLATILLLITGASVASNRFRAIPALQRSGSAIASPFNTSPFGTKSVSPRLRLVRELAWLAVPFVVVASFGMTADPRTLLSVWERSSDAVASRSPTSPPNSVEVDADQVPISTVSVSNASARPAWVDQPTVVDGDCERIVLTSRPYSTREEAELELRLTAVKLVEADLRRLQSGMFRPTYWRPAADEVIAHAVNERYDDVNKPISAASRTRCTVFRGRSSFLPASESSSCPRGVAR